MIFDTMGFCVVCTLCLKPLSQPHIPYATTVDVVGLCMCKPVEWLEVAPCK